VAEKRALLVSSGWLHVALLVFLTGFTILGILAYQAHTDTPPIPERVVTEDGRALYTRVDVFDGQQLFLQRGLMQYGSVLGHGG